jgi:hypothetical protein
MATLDASVTRPYWSIVTCETLALDPYVPAVAPLVGKIDVGKVPTKLDEFIFEIADPFETTRRP